MSITPDPNSLHGRLVAEAKAMSGLVIYPSTSGNPDWIEVRRPDPMRGAEVIWHGHRDVSPFKFAADPDGLMTKPASD